MLPRNHPDRIHIAFDDRAIALQVVGSAPNMAFTHGLGEAFP